MCTAHQGSLLSQRPGMTADRSTTGPTASSPRGSAVPSPRWRILPATRRLPKRALILLADADAFRSIGLDRRAALWAVRRLPDDVPLPLFEVAVAREQPDENAQPLPQMPLPEQVVADYQTIRLSLKGHPMEFLRAMFAKERVVACKDISHRNDRRHVRCAGVVLVRQRPGSAKGVVFMTLEDETGIANIVVWPKVMEKYRKEVMGARLILVEGYIQSSPEEVTHLVAQRMFDRSHDLVGLANDALQPQASGAGRPGAGRAAQ